MSRRGECALVDVRRGVWTRRLLVVHGRQQVGWGGRMRLCRSHLAHQVRGVDGLLTVLLRLRVQQLRIQGCAEVRGIEGLVLVEVGAREEAVEVGIAVVCDVERLGLEVAALRPEVRRVVLRQALAGLQEVLVEGGLLRELLRLRGSQELGAVEARRRDGEARGGVERGVVVGYVTEGMRRRGRRSPYMIIALTRGRGTAALLHRVVV
jgi:hypothetical protein